MHTVRKMRPFATDVAHSVVCVSVCVGHTDVSLLCKRLNRSTCYLGADSCGPKEPCNRWGSISPRKGAILGIDQLIGSLCCGVRSKRNHSALNNCTACDAAFCL